MAIAKVGVAGCSEAGIAIAEILVRSGVETVVYERDEVSLNQGRQRIQNSITRVTQLEELCESDREAFLRLLTCSSDLGALEDRELIIEATNKGEAAKCSLFTQLDLVLVNPLAILASKSSSVPIMSLAMATSRPDQVIGLHFTDLVVDRIEVVPSLLTSKSTLERTTSFVCDQLGKTVTSSLDRADMVVNALVIPFILSAIRMVESGSATPDEIDRALRETCVHPMGPLRLADLIGLDTTREVAEELYDLSAEQRYSPPLLLSRMVDAGLCGRKSNHGFYSYD